MKSSSRAASATSLPRAPRDDAGARSTRYLIMMGVRIACFILMVVITPYGWYTWVLGAAAIFLPYVAVISANVGQDAAHVHREDPERALTARAETTVASTDAPVIRIEETRAVEDGRSPDAPA